MSMFCYQCQETAKNEGCTIRGVCGKVESTANLQDLLIYLLKGISIWAGKTEQVDCVAGRFVAESLFATITNANFDDDRFVAMIRQALTVRDTVRAKAGDVSGDLHDSATWTADTPEAFAEKAKSVGVLATENEDIRSLRELITYGVKGLAAYMDHAAILGYEEDTLYAFIMEALAASH